MINTVATSQIVTEPSQEQRIEALEAKRDAMRIERNTWRTKAHDRFAWLVIRDRTIHQLHLRIKRLEHELWGKEKSGDERRTKGGHMFNCSSTYVGVTECNCGAGVVVQTSVPSVAK